MATAYPVDRSRLVKLTVAYGGAAWAMRLVRLPKSRTLLYDLLPHALPRVSRCATSGAQQLFASWHCFVGSTMLALA